MAKVITEPDARMVKALCGSLKMAFDSAKVNFIEASEAIQTFHRLLKKLENYNHDHVNAINVTALKEMISRIKQSISFLRSKLTKNSDAAHEGFKLLQDRLEKVEEILRTLSIEKTRFEEGYKCYKRLRTGSNSEIAILKKDVIADRRRKLEYLEKAITSTKSSISNVTMEKEALSETCYKMEEFLDGTNGFIKQLRNHKIVVYDQGATMSSWCTKVLSKLNHLSGIRQHTIDNNTMAFEFVNPPMCPAIAPRLILTTTFIPQEHKLIKYALMHAKVNHESVDIVKHLDYAIQKNDILYLLATVRKCWNEHFPLLLEVVILRERYPIDWQPEVGKLCVLLGERANINCTLNIHKDYPKKGCVSIERIEPEQVQSDIEINSIKPDEGEQSLTSWVECLAKIFHKLGNE